MTTLPAIPTKYYYLGDRAKALGKKGLGKKRFNDLITSMGFQGLETGFNTLKLKDGTIIKTSMNYGISTISIYVPIKKGKKKKRQLWCFCGPCMASAKIKSIKNYDGEVICRGDEEPGDPCVEDYGDTTTWGDSVYQQYMGGARYFYNIDICVGDDTVDEDHEYELFISLENYPVFSLGWEKFYVGQKVYVMFLPDDPVDMDETTACLYDLLMKDPPLPEISDLVLIPRSLIKEDES